MPIVRNAVSQPNLDEAVFCRVVEDIGDFQLDEYVCLMNMGRDTIAGKKSDLHFQISICPYATAKTPDSIDLM
ncbi:hypothetical protein FBU30_010433 [Linnemannia zychae]|nr:hypothetical protein FBU30_010433 [Linnemannia zychae]